MLLWCANLELESIAGPTILQYCSCAVSEGCHGRNPTVLSFPSCLRQAPGSLNFVVFASFPHETSQSNISPPCTSDMMETFIPSLKLGPPFSPNKRRSLREIYRRRPVHGAEIFDRVWPQASHHWKNDLATNSLSQLSQHSWSDRKWTVSSCHICIIMLIYMCDVSHPKYQNL